MAPTFRYRQEQEYFSAEIDCSELSNTIPKEPFFFLKPTSSYLADGGVIEIPKGIDAHHEGSFTTSIQPSYPPSTLADLACSRAGRRHRSKSSRRACEGCHEIRRWLYAGYRHVRWFYSVASILSLGLRRTARNLQEVVKKKGLPWSAVKGWETATRASTC